MPGALLDFDKKLFTWKNEKFTVEVSGGVDGLLGVVCMNYCTSG